MILEEGEGGREERRGLGLGEEGSGEGPKAGSGKEVGEGGREKRQGGSKGGREEGRGSE